MNKKILVVLAFVALILQFVFQLHLAKIDARTTDEGGHLAAGYTYVTTGEWRFNPEHPPLTKVLAGLAILPLHPKITPEMNELWDRSSNFFYDSWSENRRYGEMILYEAGNDADQLLFWGRFPAVILTFLLGLSILLIAWREWGGVAALVATLLFVLDPAVTAHGHLINTDLPAALGYLLAIYAGWKFFVNPEKKTTVWFGLAIGLALLLKYTTIIALPALLILAMLTWVRNKKKAEYCKKIWLKLLAVVAISIFMLWLGYGFHDRVVPISRSFTTENSYTGSHRGSTDGMPNLTPKNNKDKIFNLIRPIVTLVPGDYIKGLFMVFNHVGSGHKSFLLGQVSTTGWWYYFPLIILVKTPIPTLILMAMGLYIACKKPRNWLTLSFIIGATIFLLASMTSKANLGVRHILPFFPLLYLVSGYATTKMSKKLLWITTILLIWLGALFAFSYPYYLGYFNEFAGGSYNGYKIAADSNLDWGQDLKRITEYVQQNKLQNVFIEYTWNSNHAIDYHLGENSYKTLDQWKPGAAGWGIIGATAFDVSKRFSFMKTCPGLKQITPGVFICKLN
ncbi:hypothetical protein COT78_03485 [Candidatus Berkelbacteria bacterium CG10_big_fil_rev_8_21_14_0_10_43_13]|uniref:Glycosyltransferase RgtA/B/C/D-like domain-containing protein n=1 Tax=Candidatus Berkelbacteria bacterium CG10_big_fil_rev_8_21_14_0_10_43_13 TaxID=1974514 RepID=A0A2H0W617_9BACT|nr:MAG: hypothetical protein COT78_03485 [Candidatus Berkelbacteria bacterium CG10_big_fil_rev_8_21_14_0_10_43_13]